MSLQLSDIHRKIKKSLDRMGIKYRFKDGTFYIGRKKMPFRPVLDEAWEKMGSKFIDDLLLDYTK